MAFKQLFTVVTVALALNVANGMSKCFVRFVHTAHRYGYSAAITKRVACPDGINTATNAACCALFPVRDDLNKNLFNGGQCNDEAHEAFRLTFHDAIAISPALEAQGKFGLVSRFCDV